MGCSDSKECMVENTTNKPGDKQQVESQDTHTGTGEGEKNNMTTPQIRYCFPLLYFRF